MAQNFVIGNLLQIIIVCFLTYVVVFNISRPLYRVKQSQKPTSETVQWNESSQDDDSSSQAMVNISDVAQIGRNERKSVRSDILLFNRVQKSGGVNFVRLIQSLETRNQFRHFKCDTCPSDYKRMPYSEEQVLIM